MHRLAQNRKRVALAALCTDGHVTQLADDMSLAAASDAVVRSNGGFPLTLASRTHLDCTLKSLPARRLAMAAAGGSTLRAVTKTEVAHKTREGEWGTPRALVYTRIQCHQLTHAPE